MTRHEDGRFAQVSRRNFEFIKNHLNAIIC